MWNSYKTSLQKEIKEKAVLRHVCWSWASFMTWKTILSVRESSQEDKRTICLVLLSYLLSYMVSCWPQNTSVLKVQTLIYKPIHTAYNLKWVVQKQVKHLFSPNSFFRAISCITGKGQHFKHAVKCMSILSCIIISLNTDKYPRRGKK